MFKYGFKTQVRIKFFNFIKIRDMQFNNQIVVHFIFYTFIIANYLFYRIPILLPGRRIFSENKYNGHNFYLYYGLPNWRQFLLEFPRSDKIFHVLPVLLSRAPDF